MDDLSNLDWSAPPSKPTTSSPSPFAPYRQSPTPQLSGRSTPLSAQQSGAGNITRPFKAPSKPATPANDSFAGLVSLNSTKSATSNLSLQERQKQLQEEKLRQEAERSKQYESHFGASDSKYWDTLGSGKSTPEPTTSGLQRPSVNLSGGSSLSKTINKPFAGVDTTSKRTVQSPPLGDDILAAFNSSAPVDNSSHFPPPNPYGSGRSTPATTSRTSSVPRNQPAVSTAQTFDDDDDMFGLKQLAQKSTTHTPQPPTNTNDDDDILGLLGKPINEFQKKAEPTPRLTTKEVNREPSPDMSNPQAKAVAELVDMGFPADKAAVALTNTESGLDVQAAVGWLLNQAHAEAKQKSQQRGNDRPRRSPDALEDRPSRSGNRSGEKRSDGHNAQGLNPAWMSGEQSRSRSGQRRQDGNSGAQEKDVAQYASDIGSTLFKSANSLWKTGRKQVQKAVADFQHEGDPNVPKWMREAQSGSQEDSKRSASSTRRQEAATDEAMMLEGGGRPIKPARSNGTRHDLDVLPIRPSREHSHSPSSFSDRQASRSPAPRQQPQPDKRPAARLTRQDIEEQTSQAYVSPARRKKTTPQPDLFSSEQPVSSPPTSRQSTPSQSKNPFLQAAAAPKTRSPAVKSPPVRPRAPPRRIPPASSSAMNSSTSYRQKGSDAYKRGDYSEAHIAYTSALGPLPQDHPVAIIVLCNRAVTNIKVGDPKAAISDADAALAIIGVSKGEGEKIALGGIEGDKDMKEFYGKALMRKAEALEHMEKWTDAGKVWREAVEAGVGGSISIQGRNRCEKAAGGSGQTSAPSQARKLPVRRPPPPKPSALSDLGGGSGADSEAVRKLKAANAAAEKADDEKFALSDQVDAKLISWKGTKADNLRALLGSMDKVLWPEAGWKKVNMGDLVMPNKVKIIYMKAIAKVHPDKVRITHSILLSIINIRNSSPKRLPPNKR